MTVYRLRIRQEHAVDPATLGTAVNGIVRNAEGRIVAFTRDFYSPLEDDSDIEEDPALPKDDRVEQVVEEPEALVQSKKVLRPKRFVRASQPSQSSSNEDPIHIN